MTRHHAFGLALEDLDVVVVDDSRPMLAILRSTLLAFKVRRVRTYEAADEALESMRLDPPNLLITDLRMAPTSGLELLRMIRQRKMAPLCFMPVLVVTANTTQLLVDKVLRAGAHNILVKPMSPSALYERLNWLRTDDRPFALSDEGRYVIDGVAATLDLKLSKSRDLGLARANLLKETLKRYGPARPAVPGRVEAETVDEMQPRSERGFASVRSRPN